MLPWSGNGAYIVKLLEIIIASLYWEEVLVVLSSNSWEVLSNLYHSYWSLDIFYMLMTFTKPNNHLNVNPIYSWTVILIYVQISILNPISRLYSWVLPRDKYQKPLRVGVMLRNYTHAPYPIMVSDIIIPTKVETLF